MKKLEMPEFSLGWELEAISGARRRLSGILVDHDGSVRGEQLEYKTKKSIVYDPCQSIHALRMLTTDPFLRTDDSCGFHVHIGLGKRARRGSLHPWAAAFVTLARHIENDAFRAVPISRTGSERAANFCRPWADDKKGIMERDYPANKYSGPGRYNWVNPVEIFRPGGIRTIEVRLMGDSHRFTYLLSWASFCRIMAQKAWIVAHDISREQECIDELRDYCQMLRKMFQEGMSPREVARKSVYLSYQAGIYFPMGKPLEKIKMTEKDIEYRYSLEVAELEMLNRVLRDMDRGVTATARYVASQGVPSGEIVSGDTVRCVSRPSDGNATLGGLYRVIEHRSINDRMQIIGDNGESWWVKKRDFVLVERSREVLTCAV